MKHMISSALLIVTFAFALGAQTPEALSKGEAVIKQARAAIGDDGKLHSLSSLTASGPNRRLIGATPTETEIEYAILFPDKFRRSDIRQPFQTITVMEEDRTYVQRIPNPNTPNINPDPFRDSNDPQIQARREAARRADFSRFMLGWFLTAPASNPVEYSYAGVTSENGITMEMVDAKGQGNFKVRLYLDQKSHRLTMLTYMGRNISAVARSMSGTATKPALDESKLTPEQKQKMQQQQQAETEQRRKEFQEAVAKAPMVEIRWVFSNYKNVSGLTLPHHVAKYMDGSLYEEWEINKFKINPKITAAMFERPEKP